MDETQSRQDAEEQNSEGEEVQPPVDQDTQEGIDLASLQQALNQAEQLAAENMDKFVRSQAEMENLRRRTSKELQNARQFGLEPLVKELIPVRDSLERGLHAASEHEDSEAIEAMREGIRLTLAMLQSSLDKIGVQQIDPKEQVFDPRMHEAVSVLTTDAVPDGHIVEVLEKGYQLHDRVIRAAMVVVAKAP